MEDMESLDVKESRSLQATRKIMVRGGVDLVFRRSGTPRCIVAGGTADAVAAIKTHYQGTTLLIEREGTVISVHGGGGTRIPGVAHVFYGNVEQVVAGTIVMVNGRQISPAGGSVVAGRALVCIDLPEMPRLSSQGGSEVKLLDLQQRELDLNIVGSGDIEASGRVDLLVVNIAGSGTVDARELHADEARLTIAGSGDIKAFVRADVSAEIAGSGDIVIHGNPTSRDSHVVGSGQIRFR
jgi:hypothetical protein